jgi:hypothetical protein
MRCAGVTRAHRAATGSSSPTTGAAESEALFPRFRRRLAASRPVASAKAVHAADWLATLPPAACCRSAATSSTGPRSSAVPRGTTFDLDHDLVRSVLRHSFAQEAVASRRRRPGPYHLPGRRRGGMAPYVLFARRLVRR